MSDPTLIHLFQLQLARILQALKHPHPHAQGPRKPTLSQQETDTAK